MFKEGCDGTLLKIWELVQVLRRYWEITRDWDPSFETGVEAIPSLDLGELVRVLRRGRDIDRVPN